MTAKHLFYATYALCAYSIGMASLVYLMAFLVGAPLPKTIDAGPSAPLPATLGVDVALMLAFLLPHSVMARPRFKAWWTRTVPPTLERATYILVSGLSLLALMWAWQPLPGPLWRFEAPAGRALAYAAFGLGWLTILAATFHIDHFDFFGLRPVWDAIVRRPARPASLTTRWLYGWVRHPISLGWLVVMWAAPEMSVGHATFAAMITFYIAIITPVEEADLVAALGPAYDEYRRRVRGFVPWPRSGGASR